MQRDLAKLLAFDEERTLLKAFFELSIELPFVTEEPIIELANYMNEPSELYLIITKPEIYFCKMLYLLPAHLTNIQTLLLEIYKSKHNLFDIHLKGLVLYMATIIFVLKHSFLRAKLN